jgi:hypothetical protein
LKKKLLTILLLSLASCGEQPLYTIGRMHIYADSGVIVPTKSELKAYLEAFKGFTGLNELPWVVTFVNEIEDCTTQGCDGKTNIASEDMQIVAQPCLGTTSFGHELTHFGIYKKTDNVNKADTNHSSPLFRKVDIDLCNALCNVGCPINVGY